MLKKIFLSGTIALFFGLNCFAQNQNPCNSEAHAQFDFWLGKWDVYNTQADTLVGKNHIKKILNSCVIEENWEGGSGFKGKSFNTYNPENKTWNQVWVDVSGATYLFSGKFENNEMRLKGNTVKNGNKILFTLTFTYDPEKKTVRQVWKASTDDGKNWNVWFDGTYKKAL